ncbi:MAG: hypothetical protein R3E89_18575 [Thiolinea sp.]
MYKTLFAPALADLDGVRHIVAIPDGPPQNLPLHVLRKRHPMPMPPRQRPLCFQADWLMKHYAFSCSLVQALLNLRSTPPPTHPDSGRSGFIGLGAALLQAGTAGGRQHGIIYTTQLPAGARTAMAFNTSRLN